MTSTPVPNEPPNVPPASVDFINKFLLCQAYLHSAVKLKKAKEAAIELCSHLNELVASESVKVKEMIKCIAILLFHLDQSSIVQDDQEQTSSCSTEEKFIYVVQTGVLAGFLNAFLLPVHTVKQGQALMDFMALPLIKLILDWIILNPSVLNQPGFLSRQCKCMPISTHCIRPIKNDTTGFGPIEYF